MIILESILATVLCTAPRKEREREELCYFSDGRHICFQAASGISLERQVIIDIQNMDGVVDVSVKRVGNSFAVSVVLDELEFSKFRKISQKELELFDQYPDFTFSFSVTPAAAMEYTTSAVYAA